MRSLERLDRLSPPNFALRARSEVDREQRDPESPAADLDFFRHRITLASACIDVCALAHQRPSACASVQTALPRRPDASRSAFFRRCFATFGPAVAQPCAPRVPPYIGRPRPGNPRRIGRSPISIKPLPFASRRWNRSASKSGRTACSSARDQAPSPSASTGLRASAVPTHAQTHAVAWTPPAAGKPRFAKADSAMLAAMQGFQSPKRARDVDARVLLIGPRFSHHAEHSGYEGFARHVGRRMPNPVEARWLRGVAGWLVNQSIRTLFRHPWYSPGALRLEWRARGALRGCERSLFHVLYGDYDLRLLPYFNRSSNLLVASFHQPPGQLKKHAGLERLVRRLDAVILPSRVQADFFKQLLPASRVFVVPHGIDTEYFAPNSAVRKEPLTIVTVGSHLRDYATFAAAARGIWDRFPEAHFIAVGTGRNGALISQIGTDRRVTVVERASDDELRAAYHRSTVAAFAFTDMTASNALLEAMAAGLPIVATDVGGIRDYLDEESGALCRPGDAESFAGAVCALLADPSAADRRRQAVLLRAQKYDYYVIAANLREIYASLLAT